MTFIYGHYYGLENKQFSLIGISFFIDEFIIEFFNFYVGIHVGKVE